MIASALVWGSLPVSLEELLIMELAFELITQEFFLIQSTFVSIGRMYALLALSKGQMQEKSPMITMTYRCMDNSMRISTFFDRAYAIKSPLIAWPSQIHPKYKTVYKKGNLLDEKQLQQRIEELSGYALEAMQQLVKHLQHLAYSPMLRLLMELRSELLPCKWHAVRLVMEKNVSYKAIKGVNKAFIGPVSTKTDTAFTPLYSLLEQNPPEFGDSVAEATPYFWGLAMRETLAADMCLLSLVEYDGLPLQFYYDMAKQAGDEIRHALICMHITRELIPTYKRSLPKTNKAYTWISQFEKTGSGLPVPLEKNLYEAMWNATLDERLILMHHDTEGPGIARIRQKMSAELTKSFPQIYHLLEVILREEITHARLGNKWLRYLLHTDDAIQKAISKARWLRSILMLTPTAHHANGSLINVINHVLSPAGNF